MGCVYPIKIKNKNYKSGSVLSWERNKYYFVPCGKCMQCMSSKKQWLETACNYEYNKYGCGAFVTLTYDNNYIQKLYNKNTDTFELNYEDFQKFMKRLRTNLYRKYGVRPDFKYLVTSELGGKTGRPHYHCLFFGLDFRNNELDIYNAWENGLIQCLPIKAGGFNYVLKYMDKDEYRAKKKYGFNERTEPYIKYSKGLGKGFIEENMEDIIKYWGTYNNGDGKRRPLPTYWLNKFCIKIPEDFTEIKKKMISEGFKNKKGYKYKEWWQISKAECVNYLMTRAVIKEKIAIRKSRSEGKPQEDFDENYNSTITVEKCYTTSHY